MSDEVWFNSWWEIRAPRVTRKDGMPVTRGEEVMLQVNTTRCITLILNAVKCYSISCITGTVSVHAMMKRGRRRE